jgi:hypothetical protein
MLPKIPINILSRLKFFLVSLTFTFLLNLSSAQAFVNSSCSVDRVQVVETVITNPDNTPGGTETQTICSPPENPDTILYLAAGTFMAQRSISLTAPMYALLMAMGIFRRGILARL